MTNASTRILGFLLALATALTIVPSGGLLQPMEAHAVEPITQIKTLASGEVFTIPATSASAPINYIIQPGGSTLTNSGVVVQSGFTESIIIDGLNITINNHTGVAIDFQGGCDATLLLKGSNTITRVTGTSQTSALVRVNQSAYVTFESYNDNDADGVLTVTQSAGLSGAAIGSDYIGLTAAGYTTATSGHITINSGTITGTGGDDGAGIGGGSGSAGGYITINGGTVTGINDSTGGGTNSAAGIGGGAFVASANTNTYIRINGGIITAVSLIPDQSLGGTAYNLCGSAIGMGNASSGTTQGNFGYIIITGGTIRASCQGRFTGSSHTSEYIGRDGAAIGGGARANASGTIIILPSADVTEVYGDVRSTGWDIGNCTELFYLNSAPARVAVAGNAAGQTKTFTARTSEGTANANMYVRIPALDTHLPGFASRVGNTGTDVGSGSGAVYGHPALNVNYYTNMAVQYFTTSKSTANSDFEVLSIPGAMPPADLNISEAYNAGATNKFNVVLNVAGASTYSIEVGGPYVTSATAAALPTQGPGGSFVYQAPSAVITNGDQTIHFGEYAFGKTGATPVTGGSFPTSYNTLNFQIRNTGTQPMNIEADKSAITSFTLSGAIVSAPAVEGGYDLPPGSVGTVTVTRKNILRAGDRIEPLKFHITNITASGETPTHDKTITVNLRALVNQEKVNQGAGNTVTMLPVNSTTFPANTNAASVNLRATVQSPDIDGVKNIWYMVDTNSTHTAMSVGYTPDSASGWTKVTGDLQANGTYTYNKTFTVPLPATDGTYYIHWYVETENTIASDGEIGSYVVNRSGLQPTLSTASTAVSSSVPYTVKVVFNNPLGGVLRESHFQVENGSAVASSLVNTDGGANKEYELKIQADGNGDCKVTLRANQVADISGNNNLVSNTLVSTLDNAAPGANFSTIKSMYHSAPNGLHFAISSGSTSTSLFKSDGSTPFSPGDAITAGDITLTNFVTGSVVVFSSEVSFVNGYFYINKPLPEGKYEITINSNSITNSTGLGIAQSTSHAFEVRIPVITSIIPNPASLPYSGGSTTLTINGTNLQYATAANGQALTLEQSGGSSGTLPIPVVISGGAGTATATLPANYGATSVPYTFTAKLNNATPGVSTTVTVLDASYSFNNSQGHGLTANPTTTDYNGETVDLTIKGINLHNIPSLMVKVYKDSVWTEDIQVTGLPSGTGGEMTKTVQFTNMQKNTTSSNITYTYRLYSGTTQLTFNDTGADITAQTIQGDATPKFNAQDGSDGAVGFAAVGNGQSGTSIELESIGGNVYFELNGLNMHNFKPMTITNDGGLATIPDADIILSGTDNIKGTSASVTLPDNVTQSEIIYTFTLNPTGNGSMNVTVKVKKPEIGVDSGSLTPAYDKHPAGGGSTTFSVTGNRMDATGANLTLRVTPVDDYGTVTGSSTDYAVASITNGGKNASHTIAFPAHNSAKLRNDLYRVEVVFNGVVATAAGTSTVEVGPSTPSLTGLSANPQYYASSAATNGNPSAITVEGNYLENFGAGALTIYDPIYDKYHTVNSSGCDMTATCHVTIPSATGVYTYTLYLNGTATQYTVDIYVGVALGQSDLAPGGAVVSNGKDSKEWKGSGFGTGGSKGGGFTGRQTIGFDVLEYQSKMAGKKDPQNPVVTIANIDYITKAHLILAAAGAKEGARASDLVGDGILQMRFDTLATDGSQTLEGRLYIRLDTPLPDLYTGVYTRADETQKTLGLFRGRYSNKNMAVVSLGHNDSFGAKLEVAAYPDLEGFGTDHLYFYRFNRETGEYARLQNPEYYIDSAGYLHFFLKEGGDIIVTDEPLNPESGTFTVEKPKTILDKKDEDEEEEE